MPADDLHASAERQARALFAILDDLRLPLAVERVGTSDETATYDLLSATGAAIKLSRLRALACEIADELDVYRVELAQTALASRVRLIAYLHRPGRSTPPPPPKLTVAEAELVTARMLIERVGNRSPSWLARQLQISWKAAEQILAELEHEAPPAPT